MSVLVTFNGVVYTIPTTNDVGWGTNLTNYLVALAAGSLQKTGGSFTLSAETDFGGAFGLKALYYKSRSVNIADAGILRMANNGDAITWRNAANTGNHLLAVDSSDLLTFDGVPVAVGGSGTVLTGTASTLAYYPSSTNTVDDLPAITASRALVSNASGLPIASVTTTTELAFVSGVTSAIQTQLNAKKSIATGNSFKFETTDGSGNLQETTVTASRALATDTNGLPVASATTATELEFVSGVTSAIQTQINTKATDSLVVHLAGIETITGAKTFSAVTDITTITHTGGTAIQGTNTNNSAASGYIGERINSSTNGIYSTAPTSGNFGDLTSITLTAGDWDIFAITEWSRNSGTWNAGVMGISTTSGNSSAGLVDGDTKNLFLFASTSTAIEQFSLQIPCVRASLTTTTTYYLKIQSSYSVSPPTIAGRITARRIR